MKSGTFIYLLPLHDIALARYTLRGKVHDSVGGAKLSFELEVCRVARLNLVGIRRKRLKGDAWIYKRVCEEILRLAQTGSSVTSSKITTAAATGGEVGAGAVPKTPLTGRAAYIASNMMSDATKAGDDETPPSAMMETNEMATQTDGLRTPGTPGPC